MWSKTKSSPSSEEPQPQSRDEVQKLEKGPAAEDNEVQYPERKVALPVVLSICLAVFLTALVSLPCQLCLQTSP